jgi:hypothetical protein
MNCSRPSRRRSTLSSARYTERPQIRWKGEADEEARNRSSVAHGGADERAARCSVSRHCRPDDRGTASATGILQPTAWRIGHALRLMVAREHMLDGTVEVDHFYLGGRATKYPDDPPPERGRKGQAKTEKTPVMAIVQRPTDIPPGSSAGDARAAVVTR